MSEENAEKRQEILEMGYLKSFFNFLSVSTILKELLSAQVM
jgi:hypothetical protein